MVSTVIKDKCPKCGKTLSTKREKSGPGFRILYLECGHTITSFGPKGDSIWTTESLSGDKPFNYQLDTLKLIEDSQFRTGIMHEMGVGKTVCSLIAIKKHQEKLSPFMVVCKSSLKMQWLREIINWNGIPAQIIDSSNDKFFPSLFKAFIVSIDLLKNEKIQKQINKLNLKLIIIDECQQIKNPSAKRTQALRNILAGRENVKRTILENVQGLNRIKMIAENLFEYHGISKRFTFGFEDLPSNIYGLCECSSLKENEGLITGRITLQKHYCTTAPEDKIIETILHEIAHAITPGAGHKHIWSETAKNIGATGETYSSWCDGTIEFRPTREEYKIPYVFGLSGTPIKNNAGEYFSILNMLRPDIFHSQAAYERDYCDTYASGWGYKVGGLSKYGAERFKEVTKSFIIRYTRDDVLPHLPKIFRKHLFCELPEDIEETYKARFIDFRDDVLNGTGNSFKEGGNLLAKLNILRHLAGLGKINPVCDFAEEFLESCERKLVLFVHHKDVGLGIVNRLSRFAQENKYPNETVSQLTSADSGTMHGYAIDEKFKTNPFARILVASTLSAGEGKNWQMCSDAVIVERQWNPANEEQAEARFPRPGSIAQSISVTYALALNTPDEYLTEIVDGKRKICKSTYGHEAIEWNQDSLLKEMTDALVSRGGKKWGL